MVPAVKIHEDNYKSMVPANKDWDKHQLLLRIGPIRMYSIPKFTQQEGYLMVSSVNDPANWLWSIV